MPRLYHLYRSAFVAPASEATWRPSWLYHLYCSALVAGLLLFGPAFSQENRVDSLLSLLPATRDTGRADLLNQLSASYWYTDPGKTIEYAAQALELAEKLGYKKAITAALNNTGVGFYQQNRYEEALQWYHRAADIHRQDGNYTGEGHALNNIGMVYWKTGQYPVAVQYYLQALKIWEDHGNEEEAASIYDKLGSVYNEQEDYERGLSYYFKALELEKKHDATGTRQSMTLSNIGTVYLAMDDHSQALRYFRESLGFLPQGNKENRAVSLSNIGLTYVGLKNYDSALAYFTEALALQRGLGDDDAMVHTLLGLARSYEEKANLSEAKRYAEEARNLALGIDQKGMLDEVWLTLADIAQKQGDFRNAYHYFRNYVAARDSVRSRENIYEIAHLQAGYETEKKQAEIEALKKERAQQVFRRNTILSGLLALLIIAGLVVSRQRMKIRQNNQLMDINAQLTRQSARLQEQTEKLRELDQMKSTFFANISHEFRTPLTLILNSLTDRMDSVRVSGNSDELSQLELMHRNARRLLILVNQLLDLSKLEAGQMKLFPENCDLGHLLQVVSSSFSSLAVARQINFQLSVPGGHLHCRLDIDKMEKILYNLLSNAFKFTPAGGSVHLKAEIESAALPVAGEERSGSVVSAGAAFSQRAGAGSSESPGAASADLAGPAPVSAFIRLSVSDSGRGISSAEADRVFNRFYQGKQFYSDEQGTGIGLALTKELVELHGGCIWVESKEGEGARFIFQVPFVEPVPEEVFSEDGVLKEAVARLNPDGWRVPKNGGISQAPKIQDGQAPGDGSLLHDSTSRQSPSKKLPAPADESLLHDPQLLPGSIPASGAAAIAAEGELSATGKLLSTGGPAITEGAPAIGDPGAGGELSAPGKADTSGEPPATDGLTARGKPSVSGDPVATGKTPAGSLTATSELSAAGKLPATGDPAGNGPEERPSILVVEDNVDLRTYISNHLKSEYQVLESADGRQGLEKAIATMPDLVISDWMMPEMDGITLCHHLKNDERTSHIPVILLTALATGDARLKGLETGADDYLTKPFDNRELQTRIRNLIEGRRRLRERFSRQLQLGPKRIAVTSVDEKFLEKVMQTVEEYMGDPEFNMDRFGQEVGLSRMQLHRKLKALTGESPGDFLRHMRLGRARHLLESRSGNVSEIAYEVGFNNLSYFSKCYREQFGVSPHESIPAAPAGDGETG